MKYQNKNPYLIFLKSKLFPRHPRYPRNIIIVLLFIIVFVTIYRLNDVKLTSQLWEDRTYETGNDMISNIMFVVTEEQANSLRPIYCQMSKTENAYIHVVFIGQKRDENDACGVFVHNLEFKSGTLEENISTLTFHKINSILNKIKPSVLIHIKDVDDNIMRNIKAAIDITSQTKGFVRIAIPLEDTKHLKWLADLSVEALKQWNAPKIQIQVITQNRLKSFDRLVRSLNSSNYFGDEVPITVNIDKSADQETLKYCKEFKWKFGKKSVKHRIAQGGLVSAIVESYYPVDKDDYAVILEDDIEVSPFFYQWTKYSILKYRYGPDRILSGRMYGVSYYNTKISEVHEEGRRLFYPKLVLKDTNFSSQTPYLCQVPCSWGAVFFPEIWREFHHYLTARLQDLNGPNIHNITVPESRSNRWTLSWKRFFIELIYLRGYVMLYPNYENFSSLSTHHAEPGAHFKKKDSAIFSLPLMKEDNVITGLPEGRLPKFENLPIMDLLRNVVSSEEIIQRGRSFHSKISTCPPNNFNEITYDPEDLLCID